MSGEIARSMADSCRGRRMLKSIELKEFTVFSDPVFTFGQNLNVFVGANGTGKTHILKLAYSIVSVSSRGSRDMPHPTKSYLQSEIARKLIGVFKPDQLGRLARHRRQGNNRCEI